ncbi:Kinesin-like protein kif9 [Gonapodya sp. JEL0774]|nr:Kinesin-like protein kif9 [Gonapodya sp. JEL0774]
MQPDGKSVRIHLPKDPTGERGHINNQLEDWDFHFDSTMHNIGQEALYDECAAPIVKGMFQGLNGTIMAYGQTGAGKTFTITGATENYKHRGLIPRVISQIFKDISEKPQLAVTARISYLEIYQEQVVDLLTTVDGAEESTGPLIVVDDKNGGSSVRGLNLLIANNEEDALNYLFEGETNKSISEHQMNRTSSRSHCIFTIYLEARSRQENSEEVLYSKLNLVDLAGSERISKTQTSGTSLREAMYINKSLTFLEQVVIALADKRREHIPYRQSKLTNVLRDSLGGNCTTLVIRMMCVTNTPTVNIQSDPMALIKKYEKEVKDLRQELSMHDTLANRSHVQYEPLTESQKYELQKQVKNYLDHDNEDLEVRALDAYSFWVGITRGNQQISSLRQIRESFAQFRNLYKCIEVELEDLKRAAREGRISGGALLPSATQITAMEKSSSASLSTGGNENGGIKTGIVDLEKEEGVGELEGGFAIGLVPSSARPQPSKIGLKEIKGSDKNKKKPPVKSEKKFGSMNGLADSQAKHSLSDVPVLSFETASVKMEDGHIPISPRNSTQTDGVPSSPILPPLPIKSSTSSPRVSALDPAANFAPPPRSEEFEAYKRIKGAEMSKILSENKAALREKRRIAKEAAEAVNESKYEIDEVKEILGRKAQERNTLAAGGTFSSILFLFSVLLSLPTYQNPKETGDRIIDEEEHSQLDRLKFLKAQYRDRYATLRTARGEVEYCDRLVDQCRRKLIQDFEQHYALTYGVTAGGVGRAGEDDLMDVAEKFEIMQLQKMNLEEAEPSAVTFFNARRKIKRRAL